MKCKARQYSDQMVCSDCKLVWDMNDPEPPKGECDKLAEDSKKQSILANIKSFLSTDEKIKL